MHIIIWRHIVIALVLLYGTIASVALPPLGQWDGVTASARLDSPYEDPAQANVPFGIISYFNMPWRAYMDTWPAQKYLDVPAVQWNVDARYVEPLCQLLAETGIRAVRVEIGWGSIGWDDELSAGAQRNLQRIMPVFKQYGIRPLILLNAHHGAPCPMRDVRVEVLQDAKQGDRTVKLKSTEGIRPGYTGMRHPKYIAATPLVTRIEEDGTVHLSSGLAADVNAGNYVMQDLKYQPLQGVVLQDGTPVAAAQESFDGWVKYAAAVGRAVRSALGTEEQADAGFDVEVWNEYTFGSNFLNINNYYAEKLEFSEPFIYRSTRERQPGFHPAARLAFEVKGSEALLPMTVDYFNNPEHGFPGVRVISGFSNQSPWANGSSLWNGQAGFSRHYYTGGWFDCTPEKPLTKINIGSIDALGNFDGIKDGKDWHTIEPGSNFVPNFRLAMPEFFHTGFKTEMMTRDLIPDSRLAYMRNHGRYTHNGDFRNAEVWMTEVNYHRRPFFDALMQSTGTKQDDPRLLALDEHLAGKMLLRQYIFHGHKGLYRMVIYCLKYDPLSFGMLPQSFYRALDASDFQLTEAVRATVPAEFTGLAWMRTQMEKGEVIAAPRPLRVDELVEYQPRLALAGEGTAARPHRWNRDHFAFLPYQLSANEFLIPYYVVTLDVTRAWDEKKDPFDPARYDMPEQEFDVTIGNVAGTGATVEAYDLLRNVGVPVQIVRAETDTLTVRLKAVDYPRVLRVTEAAPGPQINDPKIVLSDDGIATVSWSSNIPVTATVTYGRDWPNRGANDVALEGAQQAFSVQLPHDGKPGVLAVRIQVRANGLSDVWPRWDEDPQGQIVIAGAAAVEGPGEEPELSPFDLTKIPAAAQTVAFDAPAGVDLPEREQNVARKYLLSLPKGLVLTGAADDRQGSLAGISYRVRFLPRAAASGEDYLPMTSPVDSLDRTLVLLPGGMRALHLSYQLSEAAHPGMINRAQRFLLMAIGNDLLLMSATGSPAQMQESAALLQGWFASVRHE